MITESGEVETPSNFSAQTLLEKKVNANTERSKYRKTGFTAMFIYN